MIYTNDENELLRNLTNIKEKVYLFGGGRICSRFLNGLTDIVKFTGIFDNDPTRVGNKINGIEILPLELLNNISKESVFIITFYPGYARDIIQQLKNKGFTRIIFYAELVKDIELSKDMPYIFTDDEKNKISIVRTWLDEKSLAIYDSIIEKRKNGTTNYSDIMDYQNEQYFDLSIVKFDENEVFIDGGAYTGDTLKYFIQYCPKFEKYYCFELDNKNFEKLYQYANQFPNVECINAGLGDKEEIVNFNASKLESKICNHGDNKAKIVTIDNTVNEKVSFIKLDVEGYEIKTILGALNTIKKYRPKLAISIYHNVSDLWEIPIMIKNEVPEYKIHIRHYTPEKYDTVMYAI